jgi:hypothetical protein
LNTKGKQVSATGNGWNLPGWYTLNSEYQKKVNTTICISATYFTSDLWKTDLIWEKQVLQIQGNLPASAGCPWIQRNCKIFDV